MNLSCLARSVCFFALVTLLAACGGSGDNVSPGVVVVEVPVEGGGGTPEIPGGPGGGGDAPPVASVIPPALAGAVTDSGATAADGRSIFTIDISALPGGVLDPTGFTIGNDVVFTVTGGALRVRSPGGGPSPTASANPVSDCIWNIAAGATIAGEGVEDFIVIERGCAIIAEGIATDPVVFTARAEVDGTVEAGDRGLWGGLVINGFAPINDCPEGAVGGTPECTKEGEANSGTFGGNDPQDDSGLLRYVSVRYAGSNVDPENQLNGIAFQGVGAATTVEYVQVHNNLDDGIEFFGGTVNARYVVLTGNADDSLDWTDGWAGNIQYLYIEQTDSGDRAIEADNREGDETITPVSNPRIANMSVVGRTTSLGVQLRRGTGLTLTNSFVDGSGTCLRVDGESRNLLGSVANPKIEVAGTSFACAVMHAGDDDNAVQMYLDGATNVSTSGETVTPVSIADDFFEDAGFVGAFGGENWAEGWTIGSTIIGSAVDFGCPDGTTTSPEQIDGKRVCQLSGTITDDMLLTSNNLYQLVGKVTFGGDNTNSANLTIQAGTTVYGGSSDSFLVISRGSQIIANGSRTAPVTMTSEDDVKGLIAPANEAATRGQWGGLVINGNAPINDCPQGVVGGTAGCTKEGEANSGTFGGANAGDSSGTLRYLVVKYAGSNVDPENQLNGIAFQGVGSGTTVDYVQVHNNLDDGIEFFGGAVNASHVVLTGNADDSLDWTDGWTGSIQYLVINQVGDGDAAIEADNREGDETVTPRSLPSIANMTIKGLATSKAVRLRRGTGLKLYNSNVASSASCLQIEGDSLNQLGSGILFGGLALDCTATIGNSEVADINAVQAQLDASENITTDGSSPAPVSLPGSFFEEAPFIGAVENEDEDWTLNWTVGNPMGEPLFTGCPAGTTEVAMIDGATTTCQLTGTITQDLNLTRGNYYVLDDAVFIGGDNTMRATLTIASGVTVIGDGPADFLAIARGSKIEARGTRNAPVTFTSDTDVLGTAQPTESGLWGGLVINGNAPINDCPVGFNGGDAGCTKEGEANSGIFGGDQPQDDSGSLRYVVVKFAGSNVDQENQLNGIAFQGVGAGTDVAYIEVFNNLDDGIEFFGGTVNASYVVLVGNRDDSLDWTDGWTGTLQYLHIRQVTSGDHGIEADNREGDENITPRSLPMVANMTIDGLGTERGVLLRRGTGAHIYNSAVAGSAACLDVAGASVALLGTDITLSGVGLNCTNTIDPGSVSTAQIQTFLDGSTNLVEGAGAVAPVTLPAGFDPAGSSSVGSGVATWGADWTVGLD